ncbi:MAG: L,D-transpeptidase [Bacteroidales bacterium]|nr:L,D-transpeptidase [Bacteroidales bacterium]
MNRFIFNIIISLCLSFVSSCHSQSGKYKNYKTDLNEIMESHSYEKQKIKVIINKSAYKLTLMIDSMIIKEYPVVFGGNPIDDKRMEGDNCTPEGNFKMISKYAHEKWSKFIWINYPTEQSWIKHNTAKKNGEIPECAKIGGQIGIHGVPKGTDIMIDFKINWTLGCISMKNKDIHEIFPYINQTTGIIIHK